MQPRTFYKYLAIGCVVLFAVGVVMPGAEDIDKQELEAEIAADINDARENRGLPPLRRSARLNEQAGSYSAEMSKHDFISHDSPVSGPMSQRLSCDTAGENINTAYYVKEFVDSSGKERFLGNQTQVADYIVESWLASKQHRSNIMGGRFSTQGIGVNVSETDEGKFIIVTQQLCG